MQYLVTHKHDEVGLSKHKEEHLVQMHQGLTEALSQVASRPPTRRRAAAASSSSMPRITAT